MATTRMPAAERRVNLIEHASKLFAKHGFASTTTAQIAASAGISEPVLYRHFANKSDLYVACVEQAWGSVRRRLEEAVSGESDPKQWLPRASEVGLTYLRSDHRAQLWIGALTEHSGDDVIHACAKKNVRDVHAFVTGLIESAQLAGGVNPARDARAEAWIFLSVGMLETITNRFAKLPKRDLDAILEGRGTWLAPK
jgi:AcrR family transcriptional regulator